jgi:hypothetical protein
MGKLAAMVSLLSRPLRAPNKLFRCDASSLASNVYTSTRPLSSTTFSFADDNVSAELVLFPKGMVSSLDTLRLML